MVNLMLHTAKIAKEQLQRCFCLKEFNPITQQDYYGRRCGTPLHSYGTGTYTEVTLLLLWGNSAVTMEYPHRYSVGVPTWVLQDSTGATSKKQHCYFSVGTSAVILLCRVCTNNMKCLNFEVRKLRKGNCPSGHCPGFIVSMDLFFFLSLAKISFSVWSLLYIN